MAPTEGRFAMPERRWDCRRGIPGTLGQRYKPSSYSYIKCDI